MTKNPYINAGVAALYILAVVTFITAISKPDTPDHGIWAPLMVLSLFTLSAAFMAYTFFFQPVQMYIEGEKKAAVSLFTRTLISFAVITAVFLAFGTVFA